MHFKFALVVTMMSGAALGQGVIEGTIGYGDACFYRHYTPNHLASHPIQTVEMISFQSAGTLQGASAGYDYVGVLAVILKTDGEPFSGYAYCRDGADRAACALEGDGGSFTLRRSGANGIQIDLGKGGIGLEGMVNFLQLSGTQGDDRSFVLTRERFDTCNLGF